MASYPPARRRSYSASSTSSSITVAPPVPPFPWRQMLVLACCRICEPIAFMSIFPYIYYMIKSFDIASNDKEIAVYAGMVTSAFAFAEFSCGVPWGKLSDRIGRKPVLLTGLAGTGLSMIVFGFAPNLTVALIARALGGLLNGNMGVLQTTVSEVITRDPGRPQSHKSTAFSLMPFVWCFGSIIGSGLGGLLAEPVKNFPATFSPGGIFEHFPFLLPNLISSGVVVISLVIGFLFLEETHEQKRDQRDVGTELGQWLLDFCRGHSAQPIVYTKLAEANLEETTYLMHDDQVLPEYSPGHSDAETAEEEHDPEAASRKPALSTGSAFTSQVVLNIVAFGILAYHTITLEQLLPVMLSMEDTPAPSDSIVKFTGGFGLPSSTIGYIFMAQGIFQLVAQLIFFPAVNNRFGPLATFRFTAFTYPLLYLIVPFLTLLSGPMRMIGLAFILIWKVTHQSLAYPSNAMLLNDQARSQLVLGVINGVAASTASLARAVGPTLSGLIQSAGLKAGYLIVPWWASGAVAVVGAGLSLWLQSKQDSGARLPGNSARDAAATSFQGRRLSDVSTASTLAADSGDETATGEVRRKGDEWRGLQ